LAFGRNQAFGRNLTFGRILAFGNLAFGRIVAFGRKLAFGRNLAFGHIMAFGRNCNDVGPTKLIVKFTGLIGLIEIIGLVGQIFLVSLDELGIIGLVSYIGLSIIGLSRLSGISGLIGQISLICLIGIIGLISKGELGITSLVGSSALSARWLIGLVGFTICLSLATALIAAKTILLLWLQHAASHGVAMLRISASEIVNAATAYYAASSLHVRTFVREKMCWWLAIAKKKMWLWIVSFGESYNGDVLQLAEQIFSLSLPQMTKYFVMRECENIHSWISLVGDLVSSHQGEIYGFKFPKRFFGDLFQRSHSFDSFLNLII
jgi:hypothetical protein